MLDFVIENTKRFISSVPKSKRKVYGQFFTSKESARFMAEMFDIDLTLPEIRLLELLEQCRKTANTFCLPII